ADARPNAENPPGYYGPAGAPRALNLMTPKSLLKPLPSMPLGVERRVYEGDTAQPIKPQLLTVALLLLFADIVAVLLLQAGGPRVRWLLSATTVGVLRVQAGAMLFGRRAARAGAAAALLGFVATAALLAQPGPAVAQTTGQSSASAPRPRNDDARAIQSTAKVT